MSSVRVEIVDAREVESLRRAVLRPELPADQPLPPFAPDGAVTLGAVGEDGEIIGTCVVFPAPCPMQPQRSDAWQLRAMATSPARRGLGVGSAVLATAVSQVRSRDGQLMWCNARVTAVDFYARHGWVAQGAVFPSGPSDLPHRRMALELFRPPTSSERVSRSR